MNAANEHILKASIDFSKLNLKAELDAVSLSIKLWQWLHENPLSTKRDYPELHSSGIAGMPGWCPLCELQRNRGFEGCVCELQRKGCGLGVAPCCLHPNCADGAYEIWDNITSCRKYHHLSKEEKSELSKAASESILSRLHTRRVELEALTKEEVNAEG